MSYEFFKRALPTRKVGDKVIDGILQKEFQIVAIDTDGKDTFYELNIPPGTVDSQGCDHGSGRNPYECFDSFEDPYLKYFSY